MTDEFNRYYIRIRAILGIDLKTIFDELTEALGPDAPSYPMVKKWVWVGILILKQRHSHPKLHISSPLRRSFHEIAFFYLHVARKKKSAFLFLEHREQYYNEFKVFRLRVQETKAKLH